MALGQTNVVGYKYWGNYLIGVERTDGSPVYFSRLWENDNIVIHENDDTITLYKGTDDQAVDSDFDGAVTNAVPMRRLAYVSYWDHYLGENNNHAPPTLHEIHRIPYSTAVVDGSAGTSPIVSTQKAEIGYGGFVAVDKWEETIIAHKDEVRVYDRDGTLRNTVDISSLNIGAGTTRWYGMVLTYRSYGTSVNLIYMSDAQTLKIATFSKNSTVGLNSLNHKITTVVNDGANIDPNGCSACVNEDFIFITYFKNNKAFILKLNWVLTELGDYDISDDLGAATRVNGITASDEFIFVSERGSADIHSYSFTGTLIDSNTGVSSRLIAWIPGSRCVALVDAADHANLPMQIYAYDSAGAFETNKPPVQNLAGLSGWSEASPFDLDENWHNLHFGLNGTLIISEYQVTDPANDTWIMSYDSNPAQIIYDMFVTFKKIDASLIALDDLKDFGDACVANNIGMSFKLVAKRSLGAILKDILGHMNGKVRINASGKLHIMLPLSTDSSVGTIQIDDIAMKINDGQNDLSIIKTSQKDIEDAPNRLNVIYTNRFNDYKEDATFPIDDPLAQDLDAEIIDEDLPLPFFSNAKTAKKCGWRDYKINRYANDLHVCVLRPEWLFLLPGDIVVVNLPNYGYSNQRMRVFSKRDVPLDGSAAPNIIVTLTPADTWIEQFDEIDYDGSLSVATMSNPPADVFPVVWEENAEQNGGELKLSITGIRDKSDTVFCDIYISVDGESNYTFVDKLTQFANTADIESAVVAFDKEITVNTDNYDGSTFAAFTVDEQRNELSLCIAGLRSAGVASLSSFEMFSYRGTRVSGSDLVLENIARGKGYTLPDAAHTTNAVVLHVGKGYFKGKISAGWVGKTIYIKLVPGNDKGRIMELADVTGHSYVVKGYGIKSTHVAGLCGQEGGVAMGSREIFGTNDVTFQWRQISNKDGWGIRGSGNYVYQTFDESDTTGYDLLIYATDGGAKGALQATHLEIAFTDTADLLTWEYTEAQNTTDFSGLTKDFFYGIRPRNTSGVNDEFVVTRRAIINT